MAHDAGRQERAGCCWEAGLDQQGVMSSLLVGVGAVSAALAGVLIIGQEAWGLAVGRITEGRAESASGEAIFDAAIASRLINYFASPPPAATPSPS
jgi:hypothetical protein